MDEFQFDPHLNRPALLVLVRHGESERNSAKKGATYFADEDARALVKGIPDYKIGLTETGIAQARAVGIQLRQRFGVFDYAYHSGYRRTKDTLGYLMEAYPVDEAAAIKVRMNPFIRERDPGYTYDMTTAEARDYFPWLQEHWETFGGFFARPPGGESLSDTAIRVYTFINMLFRDRAGQKVLVVTHGGTLRCFRFLLERWKFDYAVHWPPGQSPVNCGITVYHYDTNSQHLLLQEYNTPPIREQV